MYNPNPYAYPYNSNVAYYNVSSGGGGYAAPAPVSAYNIPPQAYVDPQPSYPPKPATPPRSSSKEERNDRARNSKISTDTSSKDPEALMSRIFMGNVNVTTTRDDIIDVCRPFGRLKAVSLFKGYSFVQYNKPEDAAMAVQALDGYNLQGSKLDVRVVSVGGVKGKGAVLNAGLAKRPKTDFFFGGHKVRPDVVNGRNKSFAEDISPGLTSLQFYDHKQKDVLVCGSCRTTFAEIVDYIRHRRLPNCNFFEKEVCPTKLSCFTCNSEFTDSWVFVQHLIHRHSINLYKGQPKSDPSFFVEKYGKFEKTPAETDESEDDDISDDKSEERTNQERSDRRDSDEPEPKKSRGDSFSEPPDIDCRSEDTHTPPHQRNPPKPIEAADFARAFNEDSTIGKAPPAQPMTSMQSLLRLPPNPVGSSSTGSALTVEEQMKMLAEFDPSGF
ncbi:unnamed protein product [Bursaphelenchus xylophilus]|nr:unnamed protein product [Bursaphelenchus xylophilus]CAG9130510.1 unnamed protein product [Bursaphelenchus xylophilus]